MDKKIFITVSYFLILIFISLAFLQLTYRTSGAQQIATTDSRIVRAMPETIFLLAAISTLSIIIDPGYRILFSCAAIVLCHSIFFGTWQKNRHLGIYLGLIIGSTLPWWERNPLPNLQVSSHTLLFFTIVGTVVILIFDKANDITVVNSDPRAIRHRLKFVFGNGGIGNPKTLSKIICIGKQQLGRLSALSVLIFGFFLVGLSCSTSMLSEGSMHHWGAYVSPADLLLSGARPFLDFPIQYGLGPTLVISSACGADCFEAMRYIVVIAAISHFFLFYILALHWDGARARNTVTIIVCVCCFFWISGPRNINLPTTFPSTSGLRFLPVLILVTLIIFLDRGLTLRRISHRLIIHAAWAAGVLWSIESAFYVTSVWWPYCLVTVAAAAPSNKERTITVLREAIRLLSILTITIIFFITIYFAKYESLPNWYGYLAYALNPPGVMEINWVGPVWFAALTLVIGTLTSFQIYKKNGNCFDFRKRFVFLLMAYACFSYYLGRSHDNNILNLMPFFLLILLNCFNVNGIYDWQRGASMAMTASMVAWIGTFGYSNIQNAVGVIVARTDKGILPPLRINDDAKEALSYVDLNFHESSTVIDISMNLASRKSPSSWSSINNPANYYFIPHDQRIIFLKNGAARLNSPGWLIVHDDFLSGGWISDYDMAYDRISQLRMGAYTLVRYRPH